MPATTMPMIRQTTRISIRVNPASRCAAPRGAAAFPRRQRSRCPLKLPQAISAHRSVAEVPVTDIRIQAFPAGLTVGPHAEEVVLLAVRARVGVLVVIAPRVLADAVEIGALPVLHRRVARLLHQRLQP